MWKLPITVLASLLGLSLAVAPSAQAKAKVTKPSAPTIAAISSSAPNKGKVNVTVTIALPTSDGGSKITGSKVTAGGKTCTIKKTKTSCTIKGVKSGYVLSIKASSKNKKGFGKASASLLYRAGAGAYRSYALGEIGPGGGYIYYFSPEGFECGSGFTSTGSPTADKCHYLEVAPSGWNDVAEVGGLIWALVEGPVEGVKDETSYYVSTEMGLGYRNTLAIIAQGNDATTAAGAANAYRGGEISDWYLPNFAELNALCNWTKGYDFNLVGNGDCNAYRYDDPINSSNYGAQSAGLLPRTYWSSSEDGEYAAWGLNFRGGYINLYDKYYARNPHGVRPIRAF